MKVRIYRPAKTAMQSGVGKTKQWMLEPVSREPMSSDPLMGWSSMKDTTRELRLRFVSCEDAVRYAKENALEYAIETPCERSVQPKSYAANFAFGRIRT